MRLLSVLFAIATIGVARASDDPPADPPAAGDEPDLPALLEEGSPPTGANDGPDTYSVATTIRSRGWASGEYVDSLVRAMRASAAAGEIEGSAAPPGQSRGGGVDWSKIYAKAAPSVLFLAAEESFGTGFLIHGDGWVLTNHHVVDGAYVDDQRRLCLNAYHGAEGDVGRMDASTDPLVAVVHRSDPNRDLALLKIDDFASSPMRKTRPLELRSERRGPPRAGEEVAVIGHAGLGFLWALKDGTISAVGTYRDDVPYLLAKIDTELQTLSERLPGDTLDRLREEVGSNFGDLVDTLMVQATVPSTHGDSGGPLLDGKGRVVGICQGGRVDAYSASKVSYFVHRDEIRTFVGEMDSAPLRDLKTDIWEAGAVEHHLELPADPDMPAVLSGEDLDGNQRFVAFDLDGHSGAERYVGPMPDTADIRAVYPTDDDEILVIYGDGRLVRSNPSSSVTLQSASQGWVIASALAPDGTAVAVGTSDGEVLVVEIATDAVLGSFQLPGTPAAALALGPSPEGVWVGDREGEVRYLDLSGERVTLSGRRDGPVTALTMSPDGGFLVVATEASTTLMNPGSGELVRDLGVQGVVDAVFDGSGDRVYLASWEAEGAVVELILGGEDPPRSIDLGGVPRTLALGADGRWLCAELMHENALACVEPAKPAEPVYWIPEPMDGGGDEGMSPFFAWMVRDPTLDFHVTGNHLRFGGAAGEIYDVALAPERSVTGYRNTVQGVDVDALIEGRGFDAEVAVVLDWETSVAFALFDLDNDSSFEMVRVGGGMDGTLQSVFVDRGRGYEPQPSPEDGEEVFLVATEIPENWRPRYERIRGPTR